MYGFMRRSSRRRDDTVTMNDRWKDVLKITLSINYGCGETVGIAFAYWLDDRAGAENFSLRHRCVHNDSGAHPI